MKNLLYILAETIVDIKKEFNFKLDPSLEFVFYLPNDLYQKIEEEISEMINIYNDKKNSAKICFSSGLKFVFHGLTCNIKNTDNNKTNEPTNMFIENLINAILKDEYI